MPLKVHDAVLTADIVNSRSLAPAKLEKLLRETAKDIEQHVFRRRKTFEIFRGDSFQAVVPSVEALRVALLWRAGIRAASAGMDVRVSIGLGEVGHRGKTIAQSAGPAFERSGTGLDMLKLMQERIRIITSLVSWDFQLVTECLLAEGIIRRWTPLAAEAVYLSLMYNETQESLARRLNITQPTFNRRLATADWRAIKHWEGHYRGAVRTYLGEA